MCPQGGDAVLLATQKVGWIEGVVAWWPTHRCWDVIVFDPDHDGNPLVGHGNDRTHRYAQVREKRRQAGIARGETQWDEIAL